MVTEWWNWILFIGVIITVIGILIGIWYINSTTKIIPSWVWWLISFGLIILLLYLLVMFFTYQSTKTVLKEEPRVYTTMSQEKKEEPVYVQTVCKQQQIYSNIAEKKPDVTWKEMSTLVPVLKTTNSTPIPPPILVNESDIRYP